VQVVGQQDCDDGLEITLQKVDGLANRNYTASQRWIHSRFPMLRPRVHFWRSSTGWSQPPRMFFTVQASHLSAGFVDYWSNAWTSVRASISPSPTDGLEEELAKDLVRRSCREANSTEAEFCSSVSVSPVSRVTAQISAADRKLLLQAAIDAANTQRSRPINATTLPWLFSSPKTTAKSLQRCRMAVTAETDLRSFESCLKALPNSDAADAIQSLRGTIASIGTTADFHRRRIQQRVSHGPWGCPSLVVRAVWCWSVWGEGLQAGDRGGDLGGPGPGRGETQPAAPSAADQAPGGGEQAQPQPFGFPGPGPGRPGRASPSRPGVRRPWPPARTRADSARAVQWQDAQAVSFAQRIRSSHRARRRWRSSRSASCPARVPVAKQVTRCPSMSVNRSCAPGWGPFLADDHPHPGWPGRQVQQAGQLGDPRAGPGLAAGVIGGFPDPVWERRMAWCISSVMVIPIE